MTDVIFDNIPVGIAVFDDKMSLSRFNATWKEFMVLYSSVPQDFMDKGMYFPGMFPGSADIWEEYFLKALNGEKITVEMVPLRNRESITYWDVMLTPMTEKDRITGVTEVLTKSKEMPTKQCKDLEEHGMVIHCKLYRKLELEVEERRKTEIQLEQRTRLLSTLLEVSNLISSTLGLKPLLEKILDCLKQIIDYNGAKIFVIEGEVIKVIAHRSSLTPEIESQYAFPVMQIPLSQEIIVKREPIIIPDILSDTPVACSFRDSIGSLFKPAFKDVRSWMGIPLMIKNKVIGALTISHNEPEYYDMSHVELGIAFANQAAIEFEYARLYNETVKRMDEIKTMFAVQQAITSRLDLETVIKLIADEARRLTNAERTAVFLVDGNDLVLSVFSGKDSSRFSGYRLPVEKSLVGQSLESGKSVIVNNAQENSEAFPDLINKANIKSFLSIPLIAGTKPIGTIIVFDKISKEFDFEDERILSLLASIAAIGLENARLYQEERCRHIEDEQRRHVAEGLRDMLAMLNSNRPLEEVLEFIIHQAVRLMETDTGSLYSYQKDKEELVLEVACGLPEEFLSRTVVPKGAGAIGQAMKERRPILITDIPALFSRSQELTSLNPQIEWLLQNCKGLLAVPLICKDEVYGGIALYFRKARGFQKDDIDLVMTFADQAALAIDNARLRAQAGEVAVAAERSRLARDLHDAVTQTLFSSSLIAEVLPKIWEKNPEEGKKRLQEIRELTRGALAEMRTLLLELRPATLVEADLDDLLRQLTEATIGRARVEVTLKIEEHINLPVDVKIAFYRIAQEALNNIAKHSEASKASVTLRGGDSEGTGTYTVELVVSDNGRGFDQGTVTAGHFGVGIMRERTEAIGAKLMVDSRIGQGTDIIVHWDQGKNGIQ